LFLKPNHKEDELDIDELLSSSNYIYLEEHNKFETYDHTSHSNLKKKTESHEFVRSSSLISPNMNKLLEAPIIGHLEEEKDNNFNMMNDNFFDDNKENDSFFSNHTNYENIAHAHPE
jgi:hypothetical protein